MARHTFATTVTLANNVPIETVSKMLGHTNIKTTQHYAKLLDTRIGIVLGGLAEAACRNVTENYSYFYPCTTKQNNEAKRRLLMERDFGRRF